jgi:hypothetical protein
MIERRAAFTGGPLFFCSKGSEPRCECRLFGVRPGREYRVNQADTLSSAWIGYG